MDSMAAGERYFQQMSQYRPGREPVISSTSSANLKKDREMKKKKSLAYREQK